MSPAIELLKPLVAYPSVSSSSNVALTGFVAAQLQTLGFDVEITTYRDPAGIEKANLVGKRLPPDGCTDGGLAYCCHTDVVPAMRWSGPGGDPFQAVIQDDRVYGRGTCDMKGSLAAMLAAVSQIPTESQSLPIWILCTADEEVGFDGAKHLVRLSAAYREIVAAQPVAIIGEPTELGVVHAHKGIVGFRIRSYGRAAHSSTADGINANVAMVPMLQKIAELNARTLSDARYHDHRFDPPTLSWNFGFTDHGTAINVTTPLSEAWVSLRMMPEINGEDLIVEAKDFATSLGLEFTRFGGGEPVWVDAEAPCIQTMSALAHCQPRTVCYSTDGGQFTELRQLLVCGPGDIAQAHTTDEWISIKQLDHGTELYRKAIQTWSCSEKR
ncbi:M20 family metallopeptidase [Novipirellula artificiosorum]|uniref:Acetylornithine deacetylase n=1 Tax=Novipirellula artificiosorum TaxID=2528016 RepID=A0A5C6DG64_9BACT|nr:M20 family metallopeptidase [Novipirellula artificiosorum]TWU34974.1 Acetylornithine deacetylase [Novipirellula artificiosorum]